MLMDVFDKIYIINLPERVDRKNEIEAQLHSVGISLDDDQVVLFPAVRPTETAGFPTLGARGCFMSHLGVLEDIVNSKNTNYALILEDDCNFKKNFSDQSEKLQKLLKSDGEFIFYGGALNFSGASAVNELVKLPATQGIMGSHCIAIRRDTAEKILEYFKKMLERPPGHHDGGPMHVDGAYSWFRKDHPEIGTIISDPECVYQRSSMTDVHAKKWFERNFLLRYLISKIRKLKNKLN